MPTDLARAAERIQRRELSVVELIDEVLRQVEDLEPKVKAFALLLADDARAAAKHADLEIAHGDYKGPLHGVPIGLKDLIDTAGIPTTWGSRAHAGRVPTADAEAWRRFKAAGAILIGKTVTHEMGCGTLCPPTSNPLDLERGPGGSSGGSAAALAAGMVLGALGTDTGGSVRIPAACTGTVGFKPTFGLVPTGGTFVASWTLDHVGPMARTVGDVAMLLRVLADAEFALREDVKGLRLGVATGWFREHVQPDVLTAFDQATRALQARGAELVDVDVNFLAKSASVASKIALPELGSLYARDLDRAELLSEQVRTNLELGIAQSAADYVAAMQAQTRMRARLRDAFESNTLDALLTPTLPMTAARKDQTLVEFPDGFGETPEDAYVRFCAAFNVTGSPALSVPVGRDVNKLPIGLQVIGRPRRDDLVLSIGQAIERGTLYDALTPITAGKKGDHDL